MLQIAQTSETCPHETNFISTLVEIFTMRGIINITDPQGFLEAMTTLQNEKTYVAHIPAKTFEIQQYQTRSLKDYKAPDKFPFCCQSHTELFVAANKTLKAFPNCCSNHKHLLKAPWFNKSNYNYLPNKVVVTFSFTQHCISECLDHDEWFKEITDYIKYTMDSYGQFPEGYGPPLGLSLYLNSLEAFIRQHIPKNKKKPLLAFIQSESTGTVQNTQQDLNILIGKYKEWLAIFPFELSIFKHLKPFFEEQIPILKGPTQTNMYTGITCFKVNTKKELLDFLVSITRIILKEINAFRFWEQQRLHQAEQLQLEMILAKRKLSLSELEEAGHQDRKTYVRLLKDWLNNEKEFLNEIAPYLQKTDPFCSLRDFTDGMRLLQKNDTNEPCIMSVRNGGPDRESSFRYWFKNFFTARYPQATITAEEEKGMGRIDLKIVRPQFSDKIIEFKGWWNYDKGQATEQVCKYLTDFEKDGYVFMINHSKAKDIAMEHKELVIQPRMQFVPDSWTAHRIDQTDLSFYESKHQFEGKVETIFHFIFNVYF